MTTIKALPVSISFFPRGQRNHTDGQVGLRKILFNLRYRVMMAKA